MGDVRPFNERRTANRMDDAAAPQVGLQIYLSHGLALRVVMQGGIRMRAYMR